MNFQKIPPFSDNSDAVHVIIDTPKGSRNKFAWRDELELFELAGVLPAGAVFPYDFGFIPHTRGGDGDPLDVLVLMDEPGAIGCLVRTRLLGVIEAEQTEQGNTARNDRLIGVAVKSRTDSDYRDLDDLSATVIREIEHFFISYNAAKDKQFKPLGRHGAERARQLVRKSAAKAAEE